MYYMQVLCVPLLCNEGIVNIQVLYSIPLAWTWRYCQWYWQCLHIQTKGALITCINCCHLLELTLLCLVDLWKLDESISNFKGAWCIYFILLFIKIHLWRHPIVKSIHYFSGMDSYKVHITKRNCLLLMCCNVSSTHTTTRDSEARGLGFETYLRRVVSLSKTLYSPKVLVNHPGSGGSVPTWLKNCWLGR